MNPQVIKYRLWNLALRMNPQAAVYGIRNSSNTTAGQDTFTNYNLSRLVYRPATQDELKLANASLADQYGVWTITQVDLEQAQPANPLEKAAPATAPQLTYTLTISGQEWVIERVNPTCLNQAFECLCRLAR